MMQFRLVIAFIMTGIFILVSCSKDDNDRLEGKWQLRQIESNGETIKVDTVFYNFQTSLFMYQVYIAETDSIRHSYGFKELNDNNQLHLELTTIFPDNPAPEFLPLTDWNSLKETFTIEQVAGNKLILVRDNKRYLFRKF